MFLSRIARRVVLLLIVVALSLEIVGVGAGLSYSLGQPVSTPYASIPIQFVAITSMVIARLPYLSFALLSAALLVGLTFHFLNRRRENVEESIVVKNVQRKFPDYLVLLSALIIAAILVWLPRSLQRLPIGSDTLYYMSVVDTMKVEGPRWAIMYTDKPFLYLMTYGLEQLSGLSTLDFFRILPVFLAVGTVSGVWYFVNAFYPKASGYTSLLTALSTSLMRTSIDLYASFFAIILLLLALGIYFRNREENNTWRWIALQLILALLLLSYWFVWVFVLVILCLAELTSQHALSGVRRLFQVFLTSIIVMGLFVGVALANPPPVYWGLGSSFTLYLGRTITPAGIVTYDSTAVTTSSLALLGQDNLLFPILATLGLILFRPKTFPLRTIYVWSFTMLGFSLVSATSTHAALLFPLPILAGLGLSKLVESL